MHWQEIPRDWVLIGNPDPINDEIRAQKGRRQLTWDNIANIIGIKRQALARRLNGETPWRYFELSDLSDAWGGSLDGFLEEPRTDVELQGNPVVVGTTWHHHHG